MGEQIVIDKDNLLIQIKKVCRHICEEVVVKTVKEMRFRYFVQGFLIGSGITCILIGILQIMGRI